MQMASTVMVIFTGGNIEMRKNEQGVYEPVEQFLLDTLRVNPRTHDSEYASLNRLGEDHLALPLTNNTLNQRVTYKIMQYSPLKDSSDINTEDWIQMANDIKSNYEYDGFVIIHGTDTMAHTAAVLSFMVENLNKPIILTGSQLPSSEVDSNWENNFVGAVYLAGSSEYSIREVTLYFDNTLFRGNRVTKISTIGKAMFVSQNKEPMLFVNGQGNIVNNIQRPKRNQSNIHVHTNLSKDVAVIMLYPGITSKFIRNALKDMKGVVLLTYGTGNCPSNNPNLLTEIGTACQKGVILVNCTQCKEGLVKTTYATGKGLLDVGVIPGADMTAEAAFAKLSFLLGREDLTLDEKKIQMTKNLRGELTSGR